MKYPSSSHGLPTHPAHLTPEAYLALETESDIKHEYMDGQAYAMAGTTDQHNTISLNIASLLRNHLRGSGCRTHMADVKIRLVSLNCFYYPDLFVTCDPRDLETPLYKCFPKLIIEVLSDSTEAFDRGDKFNHYQTLSTLEEYILINTRQQRIEAFRRAQNGLWVLQTYSTDTERQDHFEIPI
ncbi:MAG: Uma2 family endonuclease [Synechococcales cyanobacterium RU_4_20]|nr:Uma2 family endonuclease [Synechococcales cyanobacterium RU_4_20]